MEYDLACERTKRYFDLTGKYFCMRGEAPVRRLLCFVAVVPSYCDHETVYAHNWRLRDEAYLGILEQVDCKLMFILQKTGNSDLGYLEMFEEDFFIFNFFPWRDRD